MKVTQIKTYSWDNTQVILVDNKCDMEDERVISFERGKQLGIEFFEKSAKENVNVKSLNHTYGGHSSHVTSVTFLHDDSRLISIGGKDTSVLQWSIT
ncbi:ras-related protein Rab-3-like isoform X1 [Lycorma delicatula]|uniref:ras-related protein Rab-3-like isoform X1 n=1 Tax=Lycorma delicatula TaxID=130591 RepID=UPI003F513000